MGVGIRQGQGRGLGFVGSAPPDQTPSKQNPRVSCESRSGEMTLRFRIVRIILDLGLDFNGIMDSCTCHRCLPRGRRSDPEEGRGQPEGGGVSHRR